MKKNIKDACDEIDAALFTGDTFCDQKNRIELIEYIERWNQQLIDISIYL